MVSIYRYFAHFSSIISLTNPLSMSIWFVSSYQLFQIIHQWMTSGIYHFVFLSQYLWDRFLKEGFLKQRANAFITLLDPRGIVINILILPKKVRILNIFLLQRKRKLFKMIIFIKNNLLVEFKLLNLSLWCDANKHLE